MNPLAALSYPPILRGFLVLLLAAAAFPLTGVFILRLNLITFRFMLMHGTLLGGAIALGAGIDPLATGLAVNLVLILLVSSVSRGSGINPGHVTSFFMVFSVGLAFAVIYVAGVPAKDTLSILWGNLYALTRTDALLTLGFVLLVCGFVLVSFRRIVAVLFSREIAFTSGVPEGAYYNAILLITGLTIAFCMKLIGALLLDALVLLPAIIASLFARSARGMFLLASLFGFVSGLAGFFLSLVLDIPASSAVTLVSAGLLGISLIMTRSR